VIWPVVIYNLMLLPIDLAILFFMWRVRNFRTTAAGMGVLVVASLMVAILMSDSYLMLRLTCIGWFAHMPIVLLLGAWLIRRQSKSMAIVTAALSVVVLAVAIDAFWIEPTWLEENHYVLTSSKIVKPMRIVVLADIQTDHIGEYERRVLKRTMDLQPDMILMAGDYLQVRSHLQLPFLRAEMNEYMRKIGFSAPLGVYAVEGNNDALGWEKMFIGLPILATQETRPVDVGDVRVTCLSMRDSFWTNVEVPGSDRFHIALGHAPNFALGDVQADLLVAGHTHGGQIRIPGLGPIITLSAVPRDWATGMTEIGNGKRLIVSRGIGMERGQAPRLRFLCRPELVIVDIEPEPVAVAANTPNLVD